MNYKKINMKETKICKLCNKELSFDNFWKNPGNKDGYFGKCKICATKVKDINALAKQNYLEKNLWTCSACSKLLELNKNNFYKRNDSTTGFQNRCKNCCKKDPKRTERYIKKDDIYLFLKDRYYGAKNRALKKNITFDINLDFLKELWISQKGLCAISNIKMTHSILEGKLRNNVSIDRIDSKIGYTKDNIQLISNTVNMMKSDMLLEELKDFCNLIINKN
jgi:hypothetical protein